ncbi:MAG: hypothetical protein VX699_14785 [Myxococcota bacterium]|nr:hypothetical protein [Myxococcota bacterium]
MLGVAKLGLICVLCAQLVFPASVWAQGPARMAVAPLVSGELPVKRVAQLNKSLWGAHQVLGHYTLVPPQEVTRVLSANPDCAGVDCTRIWAKVLKADLLALPSIANEEGAWVLRLSVIEGQDQRVLGQSREVLKGDWSELKSSVERLVMKAQPILTIPASALGISPHNPGGIDSPLPNSEAPFYKTWWFWTAVGAVSVVGTIAYMKQGPDEVMAPGIELP